MIINITESAAKNIANCRKLIEESRNWSHGVDWIKDYGLDDNEMPLRYHEFTARQSEVRRLAQNTELSWLRAMTQFYSSAGVLVLWADGGSEYSFLFDLEGAFNGGIIYRPHKHNDKVLPIGEWTTHT